MQYSEIHGYKISKLTLGTVALGLDYGVSNHKGKPSRKESFDIFSAATKAGINTLDTARSYGNAEELIGKFLEQSRQQVHIVTKFKIHPSYLQNMKGLKEEAYQSVLKSLRYLNVPKIPICLFHMDGHWPPEEAMQILPPIIEYLKVKGLIDIGGISINHPREVDIFLNSSVIEAIQIPLNIFDLRLIKNGMLDRIRAKGKIVFTRSVFLQGLFFLSTADLKGNLVKAKKYLTVLQNLAEQAGTSIAQLAFSFVRDMEGITSIVFGAVNEDQIIQNVQLLNGKALDTDLRRLIESSFAEVPEDIITPALWSL